MASPADMWSRSADLSETPKQASTCSHAGKLTLAQSPLATLRRLTKHHTFLPFSWHEDAHSELHSAVPMANLNRQVLLSLNRTLGC